MSELKLARLPDRKPVKMAITISPNLNKKLDAYADAYRDAYGRIPWFEDEVMSWLASRPS